MLAVHSDPDVCTVLLILDHHSSIDQMEKVWRKIAETEQTARLTELGLVQSSFLKFVRRIISIPAYDQLTMTQLAKLAEKDTLEEERLEQERKDNALINEDDENFKEKKSAEMLQRRKSTLFGLPPTMSSDDVLSKKEKKDNEDDDDNENNNEEEEVDISKKYNIVSFEEKLKPSSRTKESAAFDASTRADMAMSFSQIPGSGGDSFSASTMFSPISKGEDDEATSSKQKQEADWGQMTTSDDDQDNSSSPFTTNNNKKKKNNNYNNQAARSAHVPAFQNSMSARVDEIDLDQEASVLFHENRPGRVLSNNVSESSKGGGGDSASSIEQEKIRREIKRRQKREKLLQFRSRPQIETPVILRCFDELDIHKNGKLSWPRFQAVMSIVAHFRRVPPQFCSRSSPIVSDLKIRDVASCVLLPQWRLVAVSSSRADGQIHLVDASTGITRSTLKDPKQKGLITGVFLVSLPRMVTRAAAEAAKAQRKNPAALTQQEEYNTNSSINQKGILLSPGGKVRKAKHGGGRDEDNGRNSPALSDAPSSTRNSPSRSPDNNNDDSSKYHDSNDGDEDENDFLDDEFDRQQRKSEQDEKKNMKRKSDEEEQAAAVSAFPQIVTAATDGSVIVWDLNRMGDLDSTRYINVERPVIFLAFDKTTNLFFALLDTGSLVSLEWAVTENLKTHELKIKNTRVLLQPLGPHACPPTCLAVVESLSQLATSGDDSVIALWSSKDMTCICRVVCSGQNFSLTPKIPTDAKSNEAFFLTAASSSSKSGGSGGSSSSFTDKFSMMSSKFAVKKLTVVPSLNRLFAVHASKNISCYDIGAMLLEGKDSVGLLKGGHEHTIVSVTADIFGEYLVSVDEGCTICVWSARSLLLLERSTAPLTKFDKKALANSLVTCACYDTTARELITFSNSRVRKFAGIESGLCAPRSDHPVDIVKTPELLTRQLLAKKPLLVEIDDASSLIVFVTCWDIAFFSLLDGALAAHVAVKDVFGAGSSTVLGQDGIVHAFLSYLPPSRRLATDVAASFLSLTDVSGRTVGCVPASVVEAETPDKQIACFRKVLINTAAPVKVKLDPCFPLPSSKKVGNKSSTGGGEVKNLVIPSLFGAFLFAFRGCMITICHNCVITCVLRRSTNSKTIAGSGGDGAADAEGQEHSNKNNNHPSFNKKNKGRKGMVFRHDDDGNDDDHQSDHEDSDDDEEDDAELLSSSLILEPVAFHSFQNSNHHHGEGNNNNHSSMMMNSSSTGASGSTSLPRKQTRALRHLYNDSENRFFSLCFINIHEVLVLQYNRNSTTPNSTDLIVKEAKVDPSKGFPMSSVASETHNLLFVAVGNDKIIGFSLTRTMYPVFEVNSLGALFPSALSDASFTTMMTGNNFTQNFSAFGGMDDDQIHNNDNSNNSLVKQWKMTLINTAGLGKHLVLVPELEIGSDALELAQSVRKMMMSPVASISAFELPAAKTNNNNNNNRQNKSSVVSFSASTMFKKEDFEKSLWKMNSNSMTATNAAASSGVASRDTSKIAADSFILPVSWFIDSFLTTKKLQRNALKGISVKDPVIAGTCLVFKPSLANHFDGLTLIENLHQPKRESIIFPAMIGGEVGAPCVVKIFSSFQSHIATVDAYARMSQRARRCCTRILHHWDSSGDAMAARRETRLPLELDPMINQQTSNNQDDHQSSSLNKQKASSAAMSILSKSTMIRNAISSTSAAAGSSLMPPDPPPIRGIITELGRPRLRDLLHAPTVERVHNLLSVVDTVSELAACGYTSLDLSLNSIVQASDGRWKLSSIHAIRRIPAYGNIDFNSVGNEVSVLYPWYSDPDFADQFIKRRGNPIKYPSALWAVGCLAFELAVHTNVVQLETPEAGFFSTIDIMEGISKTIPANVRESVANAKRKVDETLPRKEQGFAILMLDFAAMCLLPAATQHSNFTYVLKRLREMIEAASAEHHREEVIKRTDREGKVEHAVQNATRLTDQVLASSGYFFSTSSPSTTSATFTATNRKKRGSVSRSSKRNKSNDDDDDNNNDTTEDDDDNNDDTFGAATKNINNYSSNNNFASASSFTMTTSMMYENIISFSALDEIPWILPEISKNFFPPHCNHLYAVQGAASSIIVAFANNGNDEELVQRTNDSACFASVGSLTFSNTTTTMMGAAGNNNNKINNKNQHQQRARRGSLLGQTSTTMAVNALKKGCMVLLNIDIKDGAASGAPSSRLTVDHFVHNGTSPPPLFGTQLTAQQQMEYFLQFSNKVIGQSSIALNNNNNDDDDDDDNTTAGKRNKNKKKRVMTTNNNSTTANDTSSTNKSSGLLLNNLFSRVKNPDLFVSHLNKTHLVKWRLPSKCVGASSRMTISAPLHSRVVWLTKEFGSVSNAPTPYADSYAAALLPPSVSALATSLAPVAEQDFAKLQHATLERAVVGNWESFTTGEIQALFKRHLNSTLISTGDDLLDEKQAAALAERAKMDQWERNLARRAPFFAVAVEAVSSNKASVEQRSHVRMTRAMEITTQSRRGLLDSLSLAHQGNMRRVERSRKKIKGQMAEDLKKIGM